MEDDQVFTRSQEYPVVICQQCQYAVRPQEILSHLKGPHHRFTHRTTARVTQTVRQWDGVAGNPDQEVNVPTTVDRAILGLKGPQTAWLYAREPGRCRYISTSIKNIRKHWRTEYQ